MKIKIISLTILLMIIIPLSLSAVSNAAPIFLLIEPSSRAGAMGAAYTALVDDGFAGYWNTGAMAFNRKTQFAGMHTNWLGDVDELNDIYLEHIAWNQYFQNIGNLGVNITFLSLGEQINTDEEGDYLGTFNSYEMAIAFPFAFQYNQTTGFGISFKFILSDLAPSGTGQTESGERGRGMSYAFDLGFLKKNLLLHGLDFGINFQNIGPNITYINEAQADPLPMNWRMGFAYHIFDSKLNKLVVTGDMSKVLANDDFVLKRIITAWFDDDSDVEIEETIFNAGAEYVYYDLLSLRTGYIYDKAGDIKGASFGAGFHYTFSSFYKVGLDFAFQPAGELTKWNKTFSATVEF